MCFRYTLLSFECAHSQNSDQNRLILNHCVLQIITVLSNGIVVGEEVLLRGVETRLSHRFGAHMVTGELAERTERVRLPRIHHQRFGTVIGDELLRRVVQRDGLITAQAPGGIVLGEDAFERFPKLGVEN